MTSLRGPDPYAAAEGALAALFAQRSPQAAALCRALQETVPTYTWVGLVRVAATAAAVVAQHGTPRRAATLPNGCAARLAGASTLVVDDVAAATDVRGCSPEVRALIAVPLGADMVLVVASAYQGAFGLADRDLLATVARRWDETTATIAME